MRLSVALQSRCQAAGQRGLADFQHVANCAHGVPVSRGCGHTEMSFDDLVGVNECPPDPPVQAQGEHAADPDYLDLPVVASRLAYGKGRRTLTNRLTSLSERARGNGSPDPRSLTSRARQIMRSAANGNLRFNATRSEAELIDLRTTKVPAAPTLTTSNSARSLATTEGRNALCPPTLTPLRNTTHAMGPSRRRNRSRQLSLLPPEAQLGK